MTSKSKSGRAAHVPSTAVSSTAMEAAWEPGAPAGDAWTARPWVHPTERATAGRAARKRVPRASHAAFEPASDRDPIAILAAQEVDRLPDLVPLRHERMAESRVRLLPGHARRHGLRPRRHAAHRTSLSRRAATPTSRTSACSRSPERTLVFDANDFDETLPGPWEWDVKRLAASVVIAGRANGFSAAPEPRGDDDGASAATASGWRRYAGMRLIDVWYASITEDDIREAADAAGLLAGRKAASRRQRARSDLQQGPRQGRPARLRVAHGGGRRPPGHPRRSARRQRTSRSTAGRARSRSLHRLPGDDAREPAQVPRALPLRRRRPQGRRRRQRRDALLRSSCSRAATRTTRSSSRPRRRRHRSWSRISPPSGHANHGQRVVVGQQLMQATPDIFLGWTRGPGGRDFYFRQLWDMKGSVDTTTLQPPGLGFYGRLCGWALARAHARSGDAVAIAAYLGNERHLRRCDCRLRRDVRRPERARPSRLRRGDQGRPGRRRRPKADVGRVVAGGHRVRVRAGGSAGMTAEAPVVRKHGNAYNIFILVLTIFSLAIMVLLLLPLDPGGARPADAATTTPSASSS